MRTLVASLVLAALLAPAALHASTPVGGNRPWDSDEGPPPTAVTQSVDCVILEVRDERTLLVRDGQERQHVVQIPEKAKIRARDKKDFDGQKKLQFEQLRPGHELELTFLTETGAIVRVKVLGTQAT